MLSFFPGHNCSTVISILFFYFYFSFSFLFHILHAKENKEKMEEKKKMCEGNRIGKNWRGGNRCDGRKDGIDVREGRMK